MVVVGYTNMPSIKSRQKQLPLAALGVVVVCTLASCEPPQKNDGREVGYYRDFNRVSNALASIPGIVVTNFFMNRDITLEEFGFEATNAAGKPIRIKVGERDPLRRMARSTLVEALTKEVERQSQ